MKHEVWPDPDVARAIDAGYVPLMVDADQDNGLSARYQVEGIPAVLVLDADGRVVKRNDGFLPRAGPIGPGAGTDSHAWRPSHAMARGEVGLTCRLP